MKLRQILPHPFDPSLALVPLTQGRFATISAVDAQAVGCFNWFALKSTNSYTFYAVRNAPRPGRGLIRMHRFIGDLMGLSLEHEVDHKDGNGLMNARWNLRDATHAENMHNSRAPRDNKSGVKGVHWDSERGKWAAQVRVDGRGRNLGRFETKEDAEVAVSVARASLHGEFANSGVH
jgi:hypothetical protein